MASQAQIEASRANGRKSRGPTSPRGRMISSMNALVHGRRSKRAALLRDDSFSYESRRCKWMGCEDPQTDMSEFLLAQNVATSCELDRARRAHLERLNIAIEDADEIEREAVYDIGNRLFSDAAGHRCCYGNTPENRSKVKKTSGDGVLLKSDEPGALVRKLNSSQMGCTFLLGVWQELRERLEGRGFFQSLDRLKIIRLLGCQPAQALEDVRIAEIFVASNALKPSRKTEFEDLLSDMTSSQHVKYCKEVWEAWPDELKIAQEPARAREILIDLCDEYIEDLNEKLEEHAENADARIERNVISGGIDESPEGRSARAYVQKCESTLKRGVELFERHQARKKKNGGGRDYQEPRKIEHYAPRVRDKRQRLDDEGLNNPDISWATDPATSYYPPTASQQDSVSQVSVVRCPKQMPDAERCQLSAVGGPLQMPSADAVATAGDLMSGQGENCQNATNEPEPDENVIIAKTQEIAGVSANSGLDSGLDKVCPLSVVGGPLSAGDVECSRAEDSRERGEGVREENGTVDSMAGGSNPESQVSNLDAEEANPETRTSNLEHRASNRKAEGSAWGDRGAGGGRWARDRKRERERQRELEMKRRELKRSLEEKMRVSNGLTKDLILDMVTTTAKMAGIVVPPLPPSRSPPSGSRPE